MITDHLSELKSWHVVLVIAAYVLGELPSAKLFLSLLLIQSDLVLTVTVFILIVFITKFRITVVLLLKSLLTIIGNFL